MYNQPLEFPEIARSEQKLSNLAPMPQRCEGLGCRVTVLASSKWVTVKREGIVRCIELPLFLFMSFVKRCNNPKGENEVPNSEQFAPIRSSEKLCTANFRG
jgi:hypothetical protein